MSRPTYQMENDQDCGPCALAYVLDIDIRMMKDHWKWQDFNDSRDNLMDSPYHHFDLLAKMGIPFKIVDANDIINQKCSNNNTVILLHFLKNTETKSFLSFLDEQIYSTIHQHWVVLHSVINDNVIVHWGDGQLRSFPASVFKKWYTAGFPNCAYMIGKGSTKLPWYVKLYAWLTGKFASCL